MRSNDEHTVVLADSAVFKLQWGVTHMIQGVNTELFISSNTETKRHAVAQLVEALRYKLQSCGFDSRWCHWNYPLT